MIEILLCAFCFYLVLFFMFVKFEFTFISVLFILIHQYNLNKMKFLNFCLFLFKVIQNIEWF